MADDILITGATGGIGFCLFERIRKKYGGRIIAVGQTQEKLGSLCNEAVTLAVDFGNPAEISKLREALQDFNIGYFFQLHGHGVSSDCISPFSEEQTNKILEVNLFSAIKILDIVLPGMITRCFGRIVLTSTASAVHGGGKDSFAYGLSKAGIEYLVKHVAKHYASNGVLANGVSPGFISTGFHEHRMGKGADYIDKRGKSVRVGYPGSPEDIARIMDMLAFDNNFVTGQIVAVDGGDFL